MYINNDPELFVIAMYKEDNTIKKVYLPVELVDLYGLESVFKTMTGCDSNFIVDTDETRLTDKNGTFVDYWMNSYGKYIKRNCWDS